MSSFLIFSYEILENSEIVILTHYNIILDIETKYISTICCIRHAIEMPQKDTADRNDTMQTKWSNYIVFAQRYNLIEISDGRKLVQR